MIDFQRAVIDLTGDSTRLLHASLVLRPGDFAALVGGNGSGKSSLLDAICGVRKLSSGAIVVQSSVRPIAYAVQDPSSGLLPWRTIIDNVMLPRILCGMADKPAFAAALALFESFGMASRIRDYPYVLSGGERQVVNIIRAALTPSDVVLLDEPFSSLHANFRDRARALVSQAAAGRSGILVTHDAADLCPPVNRFLLIEGDRVVDSKRERVERLLEHA